VVSLTLGACLDREDILAGEVEVQSDDKGRVLLPVRWRVQFAQGGFLCPGWDGCLFLFPASRWRQHIETLATYDELEDPRGVRLQRFFGTGQDVRVDPQGRILLPAKLTELVGIGREVRLCGAITRLEVWSPDAWRRYQGEQLRSDRMMAQVEGAGQPQP